MEDPGNTRNEVRRVAEQNGENGQDPQAGSTEENIDNKGSLGVSQPASSRIPRLLLGQILLPVWEVPWGKGVAAQL